MSAYLDDVAGAARSGDLELASLPASSRDFLAQAAFSFLSDRRWAGFKLHLLAKLREVSGGVGTIKFRQHQVPSAVDAVVRYLLLGDYDENDYDDADFEIVEESSPVLFNAYVLQAACDLQIDGLARVAARKFIKLAQEEILRSNYVVRIREVYGSAGPLGVLGSSIMEACAPYADKILGSEVWLKPSEMFDFRHLRAVAVEIEEFASDLRKTMPNPTPSGHDCRKSGCRLKWHICCCEKCQNEVAIKDMVFRRSMMVYCPECGTGGCTVYAMRPDLEAYRDLGRGCLCRRRRRADISVRLRAKRFKEPFRESTWTWKGFLECEDKSGDPAVCTIFTSSQISL
ncbi:hypothetical protein AC579_7576 [Pseudocercospora musae]|uniref:Uncharacterized protein n=1 Tax=Pseudocercospora musae TaxID=113226 RepID=A0A139I0W8_9PEZI|nr:hypothetical protein AC579_7576 [Pseudocercospora musae]